jgi:hypothetical protein
MDEKITCNNLICYTEKVQFEARIKELEDDAMTMALRLYGEDPLTWGLECWKVMERWQVKVKAILDAG